MHHIGLASGRSFQSGSGTFLWQTLFMTWYHFIALFLFIKPVFLYSLIHLISALSQITLNLSRTCPCVITHSALRLRPIPKWCPVAVSGRSSPSDHFSIDVPCVTLHHSLSCVPIYAGPQVVCGISCLLCNLPTCIKLL